LLLGGVVELPLAPTEKSTEKPAARSLWALPAEKWKAIIAEKLRLSR
jgi:hypothetical protein